MICAPCRNGTHPHDRWTGTVSGTRAGDDAGCPNVVNGQDCACAVVLAPTNTKGRRHCETCRCRPAKHTEEDA